MTDKTPSWDDVRVGDTITSKGTVSEIHRREDGAMCFVIHEAELKKHKPKPLPAGVMLYKIYTTTAAPGKWAVPL